MSLRQMECGPKCRSKAHAYALHSAITKGSLSEVQAYFALCYAAGKINDIHGRSALHVAASCGKTDIVEWLIEEKKSELTQRDVESGWTALHKAVFYGQLGAARLLMQYKTDVYTRDHEGLGPLDIAMKDRWLVRSVPPPVYTHTDRHEVYTWGDNANFTLGQVTENRLHTPEVIDEFRKHSIHLKQVVMSKYHTVFVTRDGLVYTCGQGHGGRLGHPTEDICVVPKLVLAMKNEVCVKAAASRDHTLLLTKSGTVYSCGLNDFCQLGQVTVQEKCLTPHPVNSKMLKGKPVKGICTGRFHSVVYTVEAVYTCGLNAGQLGHPKTMKGERKMATLRQVSALNIKSINIVTVVCSDAATVIYTAMGEIFVLHEYQCRRITSNRTDIKQLSVIGGKLDYTDSQNLQENGGWELIVSYLNGSGKVFIWREGSPSLKKVQFLIKRQLWVVDYVLTITSIAVVTDNGEVFICMLSAKAPPVKEPIKSTKEFKDGDFGRVTLMSLIMQEEIEEVQLKKVPNIHRAMYIAADRKGLNYATLQSLPNSCLTDVPMISPHNIKEDFSRLLDEADEYDLIHDVILEVKGQRWPAHKYILVSRCANFHSLYQKCVVTENDSDNIPVVKICDIHPQIFEQLILYIYTDKCDLLSIGAKFTLSNNQTSHVKEDIFDMDIEEREEMTDYHSVSAYQVYAQNKKRKSKDSRKKENQGKNVPEQVNPIKLLMDVGKKWGVKGLTKRLELVTYQNGYVKSAGKAMPKSFLEFYREKLKDTKSELYDVNLKSEDGIDYPCHRCVLVARLEYFHSMLATCWLETSTSKSLTLPVSSDILEILLDFLYTDNSPIVRRTQNVEFLCNILVVADQLLVIRLKEMCEASIAALITLKNVGELLEFASTYNAGQLRATCQQYIVLNLSALLENRNLDILSDEVMDELAVYYKQMIDNSSRRMITPYADGPDKDFLRSLVYDEDGDVTSPPVAIDTKKVKPKKKRVRTKSGTDDWKRGPEKGSVQERGSRRMSERQMSISSDVSVRSDEDLTDFAIDTKQDGEPVSKHLEIDVDSSVGEDCEPTGSIQQSGFWSPSSPTEPAQSPGCVSLREIMEQEQTETNKQPSSRSQKSARFSWKDVKKQQKEQTKMASSNSTTQDKNEAETKSTGFCPWGSVNKTIQSFRSLMIEDQKAKPTPVSKHQDTSGKSQTGLMRQTSSETNVKRNKSSGSKSILSWGLPSSGSGTSVMKIGGGKQKVADEKKVIARSPENPWNMTEAQSPPQKSFSFTEIIQDEEQKVEVLTRTYNKPLGMIQKEEQAIQDLLVYYKASDNVDELITVERVNQVAASPIWKRERLTSN